jgi:LysR family hydrogen peroxide-inducible transcriptional activator
MLSALQRHYPELQIELRETQTRVLLEELARGQLDAVMLALPLNDPDIETLGLFEDPFLLAVPATDARFDTKRVSPRDIEHDRLILLEEGHCLRDQALAFCSGARGGGPMGLGATSLATVMQMVASGYGVTLVPQIAVDVEVRDERVKLLRFAPPQPGRTVGLAWRRTSPRKADFIALGQLATDALGTATEPRRNAKSI